MLRLFAPLFLLSLLVLGLTACGPIYQTKYDYIPPYSGMGNMCISQCMQNKGMCEQMCQVRNQQCRMQAREEAHYNYQEYKHERHREGKKVRKDVSDFDRGSFGCEENCDCTPAFNACYSACGGQVVERKICVAFCDKK